MNRYKATIILIVVSIGFFASYPFHTTFIGGLLTSGFCASMIGGFADWYGISALFKKPLGIPYRTEIITKNRENILNALSKMVPEELITKEYLKNLIHNYDTCNLVLNYISACREDKRMKKWAHKISADLFARFDLNEINQIFAKAAKQSIAQIHISKFLISSIELSIANGYLDKLLDFILDRLILYCKTKDFFITLFNFIENTKSSYEKGMKRRTFVHTVILDTLLQLSSESLARIFQDKIEEYLYALKRSSNPQRIRLKNYSIELFHSYKSNLELQSKTEQWILSQFDETFISNYIASFIGSIKMFQENEKDAVHNFIEKMDALLQLIINKLEKDVDLHNRVDAEIRNLSYPVIDKVHLSLEGIIKENLNHYTDKMLIDLIESKAGNDLQLVRINGSVVGGLVGILLFLLTGQI